MHHCVVISVTHSTFILGGYNIAFREQKLIVFIFLIISLY